MKEGKVSNLGRTRIQTDVTMWQCDEGQERVTKAGKKMTSRKVNAESWQDHPCSASPRPLAQPWSRVQILPLGHYEPSHSNKVCSISSQCWLSTFDRTWQRYPNYPDTSSAEYELWEPCQEALWQLAVCLHDQIHYNSLNSKQTHHKLAQVLSSIRGAHL